MVISQPGIGACHSPSSKAFPSSKIYPTRHPDVSFVDPGDSGATTYLTTAFAGEGNILRFDLGLWRNGRGIHGSSHLETGTCSPTIPDDPTGISATVTHGSAEVNER